MEVYMVEKNRDCNLISTDKSRLCIKMNNYLKDAQIFLKKTSLIITKDIGKQQIIDATLFFALGIERLLKSILWDINPIYVLKDQSFKNTAPILYEKKLITNNFSNKEFLPNPNSDVLTYRIALWRTKEFSVTTSKYFNTLFALSNWRDIIAHKILIELDVNKLKKILLEDFICISKDYANELNIPLTYLIGDKIDGLEFLSKEFAGNLEEKIQKKLAFYHSEWERIKNDSSQQDRILSLQKIYTDKNAYDHAECPACGNVAVFSAEVDCDYSDGMVYAAGIFPTELKCPFCGFHVFDSKEMDILKLHEIFYKHQNNENFL